MLGDQLALEVGWRRISTHSAVVSGPGLRRIASGMASLPRSCSSATCSTSTSAAGVEARAPATGGGPLDDRRRVLAGVAVACLDGGERARSAVGGLTSSRTLPLFQRLALDLVGDHAREDVQELQLAIAELGLARWLAAQSVPGKRAVGEAQRHRDEGADFGRLGDRQRGRPGSPRTSGIRLGSRPSSTRWQ